MGHHEANDRRRYLRIGLAVCFILLSSCNRLATSETRSLRQVAATHVVLLEPSSRGYVVNHFGESGRSVDVGVDAVTEFTADLRSAMRPRILEADVGRVFELQLVNRAHAVPLFRMALTADIPRWKLRWGSPSGNPALLQFASGLYLRCLQNENPTKLAEDVIDFDVLGTQIILLRGTTQQRALTVNHVADNRLVEVKRLPVPNDVSEVAAIDANRTALIGTSADGKFKESIRVLNLPTAVLTNLSTKSDGQILDVIPLRGTGNLILDEWDGDERVDGSLLTKLYLLNVDSGRRTWIWSNYKDELVQELPPNAARFTCP
jgi:hypothetical protein